MTALTPLLDSTLIHAKFPFVPPLFPSANTEAMMLPGFIFTSVFNHFLPFEQRLDTVFSLGLYLNLEAQNAMG